MIGRLHERGGLLARAAEVSGGQHLQPSQCDFIGPYPSMPVWGSSLGALGPDTSLRLSPRIGPPLYPLLLPLTLGLSRLVTLTSHAADLTTRAPDGVRTWLDLGTLLPDLNLLSFPPSPQPHEGDPASSRPGQFWRLRCGTDDWAWGGKDQILSLLPDTGELSVQR